jgi:hypothetical protein
MPKVGEKSVAITVAIRVRPINVYQTLAGLSAEKTAPMATLLPTISIRAGSKNTLTIGDPTNVSKLHTFSFDHVFNSMTPESTMSGGDQFTLFQELGMSVLQHTMQGYNTCLFAYGQTGSGKTYTISGFEDASMDVLNEEERVGLLPRLCEALCTEILAVQTETRIYRVEMSYYEIYNEKVRCLLDPDPNITYRVREHPVTGPFVVDLKTVEINSFEDMMRCIRRAQKNRQTANTNMNATSSRSHSVCCLTISSTAFDTSTGEVCETVSKMNIVDLAGSERCSAAGTVGQRLVEGSNINRSLLTLGNVIEALAGASEGGAAKFVPYRESTLTWLLKEALGGNSRTVMLACVSPNIRNYEESLNTLKYADRAKQIKNLAAINVDSRKQLVFDLKAEIQMLREQLEKARACAGVSRLGANSDAVVLPRECPFLLQINPTPALRDPFVYYLAKPRTVVTKETGARGTETTGLIELQGRMGVHANHMEITRENLDVSITGLSSVVRVDSRDVHAVDLPESLTSGLDVEIGAYTFKIVNPLQTVLQTPEERELGVSRRMEKTLEVQRKRETTELLDRLQKVIDISKIGHRDQVLKRKSVVGDKVVARSQDTTLAIFEWTEAGKWEEASAEDEVITEVIGTLSEQISTSAVINMILGNSLEINSLPWEHDLADVSSKSSNTDESIVLARSAQFENCVAAVKWDPKQKLWLHCTPSAAETCALREIERRRVSQHTAAVEEIQARVTDLASVQARASETQATFVDSMRALNESVRVAQTTMQRTNQEIVTLEQRALESVTSHRQAMNHERVSFAERMDNLDSTLRATQQTHSQLTETIESKSMDVDAKLELLRMAEEARDQSIEMVKSVKESINTIQREITRAQTEDANLTKEIETMHRQTEQTVTQKEALDKEVVAAERITEEQCEAAVISLREKVREETEQESQLFRNLQSLQSQCQALMARNRDNEEQSKRLTAQQAELQEQIAQDEGELNGTLAERRAEAKAKFDKINAALSDAKKIHAMQSGEMQGLIDEARKDERRVLMAKMSIQEEQHSRTIGMSRAGQQATVRTLQRERAKAKETLQATIADRDSAKRRLKELETLFEQREKQATTLRDEHAGWHTKLQVCKQDAERRKNAMERLSAAEAKLKATTNRVTEVEKGIRTAKREEEECRVDAKTQREAAQKVRAELDAAMAKLKAAEKDAKLARTEATDAKREAQAILLRLDDLRETLGGTGISLSRPPGSFSGQSLTPRQGQPNYMRGTQASHGKAGESDGDGSQGSGMTAPAPTDLRRASMGSLNAVRFPAKGPATPRQK